MDFFTFSQLMATCSQASRKVHEKLVGSTSEIIAELMKGVSSPEMYCFRIPMGSGRFTHLSVSVPPDAMGNRGPPQDSSTVPECIETALVGPDGNLVYIDGLEYSDVCRFYGDTNFEEAIPSLEAEILRLLPYAQGEKQIPEEGSSSESEEEEEERENNFSTNEWLELVTKDVPLRTLLETAAARFSGEKDPNDFAVLTAREILKKMDRGVEVSSERGNVGTLSENYPHYWVTVNGLRRCPLYTSTSSPRTMKYGPCWDC